MNYRRTSTHRKIWYCYRGIDESHALRESMKTRTRCRPI